MEGPWERVGYVGDDKQGQHLGQGDRQAKDDIKALLKVDWSKSGVD